MTRLKALSSPGSVVCLISVLIALNGCGGLGGGSKGPQQLTVTTQSLPSGTLGSAYSQTLSASGGVTPYTWSITAGALPAGLSLAPSTGVISGTPTGTAGTSTFTVKVTDSESPAQTATAQLSITINAAGQNPIKHVVIIFQENRTTDNLFQGLCIPPYGSQSACGTGQNQYDIAQSGKNSLGQTVTLQPACLGINSCGGPLPDVWDMGHAHRDFVLAWDNGKMDGFDEDIIFCPQGGQNCSPANPEYYYVQPSDVQPYLTLAQTYTFADHMFQTNQGPSFPAHQYIIAGTSAYAQQSGYDIAENPSAGNGVYGCIAPPAATVKIINTQTGDESQTVYPCTDHPTLTDLLDAAGLGWKYYTPAPGSIWNGPVVIQHICGPNQKPPNGTECVGTEWTNHIDIQGQNNDILNDIAAGQLAAVSWVIPHEKVSDHSGTNDGSGPSWVAAVVNAIGNSPYWADTAILISWDDWGGWYDHVPPPAFFNAYEMGFRVPLIVVSPYAKPAYVSKNQHDFGSILHFVENTFGLGFVDGDQYADARADDLSDCFNFSQNPLPFKQVKAPLGPGHFLNNTEPPGPPDDD